MLHPSVVADFHLGDGYDQSVAGKGPDPTSARRRRHSCLLRPGRHLEPLRPFADFAPSCGHFIGRWGDRPSICGFRIARAIDMIRLRPIRGIRGERQALLRGDARGSGIRKTRAGARARRQGRPAIRRPETAQMWQSGPPRCGWPQARAERRTRASIRSNSSTRRPH
jgi:hypothetical protein